MLLPGVGGRGQQALLNQAVVVTGPQEFASTAAAYLEAGGSRASTHATRGFLAERVDSTSAAAGGGLVCVAPITAGTTRPLVALGQGGGALQLVCASEAACPDCVDACVAGLEAPTSSAALLTHGAVAAVAFQRLVLGLASAPLECFGLDVDGALTALAPARCSVHREPR